MSRPYYCPCHHEEPDPCPACGATVAGNDPVRGVCQATRGAQPRPLLEVIVVHRDTGEPVSPRSPSSGRT